MESNDYDRLDSEIWHSILAKVTGKFPDTPSDRLEKIGKAAIRLKRMELARFYFTSSDYCQEKKPDKRSCDVYFEEILNPKCGKTKMKNRLTIDDIGRLISHEIDVLEENEHITTEFQICFFFKFNDAIREKRITRWPRIYVSDDKEIKSDDKFVKLNYVVLREQYIEDGKSSEINYDAVPTIEEMTFKGRPPNKFTYKYEQINLNFVKNLTKDIERSIIKGLKPYFKVKNKSGEGFSAHHIIPLKKLGDFHTLFHKYLKKLKEFPGISELYHERDQQSSRMLQLCIQFGKNGLMELVPPYEKHLKDSFCSLAANMFYGPESRSDDVKSGSAVDRAANVVLTEKEYESIICIDNALNEFSQIYGFQKDNHQEVVEELFDNDNIRGEIYPHIYFTFLEKMGKTFSNIEKNHNLEPKMQAIPFDPRLVDLVDITSNDRRWFYRHRKIAEKSLPNWLSTLLQKVSDERQVVLDIDLNLNPIMLKPDNKQEIQACILRIRPRILVPNYVASSTVIFAANFVASVDTIYEFNRM